jgi:hypothetical protein
MAALALAMKSIFQVQGLGSALRRVTFLTFLHRQALTPNVAATDIIVMAGGAVQPGGLVRLVPEKHRPFRPRFELGALQGTHRFRFNGGQVLGTQKQHDRQSPKKYLLQPSSLASSFPLSPPGERVRVRGDQLLVTIIRLKESKTKKRSRSTGSSAEEIRGAGILRFPDRDPGDFDPIIVDGLAEAFKEVAGHILRRRILILEGGQFIKKGMIDFREQVIGMALNFAEIKDQTGFIETIGPDEDFHFPIMAVQGFALAIKIIESMGGGEVGDNF